MRSLKLSRRSSSTEGRGSESSRDVADDSGAVD